MVRSPPNRNGRSRTGYITYVNTSDFPKSLSRSGADDIAPSSDSK